MSGDQRYRVEVNVRVTTMQEYPYGSGQWQPSGSMSGGLEVSERADVTASGFMELAGILGRFHELTERIKAERGDVR